MRYELLACIFLCLPVSASDIRIVTNQRTYIVSDVLTEQEAREYLEPNLDEGEYISVNEYSSLKLASTKALVLPPSPTAWRVGQTVHVKTTGMSDKDRFDGLSYVNSKIRPLHLDFNITYDNNIKLPNGSSEGISIVYTPISTECYGTRRITGYENGPDGTYINPHVVQVIKIGTDCVGGRRDLNEIYWFNVLLHEFCHALFMDHLTYVKNMEIPLMNKHASLTELLWTYADQWQLKRAYCRSQLVNYKRMNFKRADVGKTCYLIKDGKSVCFPVKYQSELLPFIGKLSSYKAVIK